MNQQIIWEILEISKTKNEDEIKQAYRKKLVSVNPEDDASGFMKLREAYEEALRFIRKTKEDKLEKNREDLWIDRVDGVYSSMKSRIDERCWSELLEDDLCIGIDTSEEVMKKLLVYLMNHFYLPQKVWKLLDGVLMITDNREKLYDVFPVDFVDYVIKQITCESFLDYTLFQVEEEEGIDQYINVYFKLKGELDNNRKASCSKLLKEIEKYAIYHPYKDVEKMRYYLLINEIGKANQLSKALMKIDRKDSYIRCYIAKIKYKKSFYEEATIIYRDILQFSPSYYLAKVGLAACLFMKKEYVESKQLALELLSMFPQDEKANSLLQQINEVLIEQYKENSQTEDIDGGKLELAWCLYQNQRFDESVLILEQLPERIHEVYDYINLRGRVYLAAKQYDIALLGLKEWLDVIVRTKRDDMLGYVYYYIGMYYTERKEYKEAIPYYLQAVEEESGYQKLFSMERLAYSYLKMDWYKDCIGICENMLGLSKDYYPAYIHRQEANYELERYQEVIHDYYKAININPDFIKPYLFGIKAFCKYKKLEEANNIVKLVQKRNLTSNEFDFLRFRIAGWLANTEEEFNQVLKDCLILKRNLKDEGNDLLDKSSVDLELALIYDALTQHKEALEAIEAAIIKKPREDYYYFIKGCILIDMKRVDLALVCFLKINEINPKFYEVYEQIIDIYLNKYKDTESRKYYELAKVYADKQVELKENSCSLVHRGLVQIEAYVFDKAIEDCNKALEYESDEWAAYNNLGFSYMVMGEIMKAIKAITKAVSLVTIEEANYPYANLAASYHILRQYKESIKYYEALHKAYPDISEYIEKISDICRSQGEFDRSIGWQNKLLIFSNYSKASVYSRIGEIYFLADDTKRADDYFKKSLRIEPKNIDAFLDYAKFLYFSDNIKKAIKYTKKATKFANPNNSSYIEVCEKCAALYWSYWKRNKSQIYKKEAKRWGKMALQAIEKFFGSEKHYYSYEGARPKRLVLLASIYLYMGEEDKVECFIKQALSERPCKKCSVLKCVKAYEIYGMFYEARSMEEIALDYYSKIIELDPGGIYYQKRFNHVKQGLDDK